MLDQKIPPLVFHKALLQPRLAAFDLGQYLLQFSERFLKTLRRGLILLGHLTVQYKHSAPCLRVECVRRTAALIHRLTLRATVLSMIRVTHPHMPSAIIAPHPVLGQTGDPLDIAVGVFFLAVLLVGGFFAVIYVKKWLKDEDEPNSDIGFTLGDLKKLHKNGRMSDEEFEKARVQMIDATQRAAQRAAILAAEEAKKRGGVTDIEELRSRARRVDRPGTRKNADEEGEIGR